MIKLRSRKGVSGAISAMFVIAIFFIILVSTFAITGMTNSYNQVVIDRNRMDWDRNSEHVTFIVAAVGANKILNVSFSNDGRVTLHIVQVWLSQFSNGDYANSTWQQQFWASKYVSSGETVNDLGYYPEFKRVTSGAIGAVTRLQDLTSQYYKIKLVTERGNVFECQVPYPPPSFLILGGGFYALVISDDHDNWQYSQADMTQFKSAYLKPRGMLRVLYRILLRNTTNRTIDLLDNCTMIQSMYSGGGMIKRYIVSAESTNKPDHLVEFSSQSIDPGEEQYLYFAAEAQGGDSWVTTNEQKAMYMAGFSICFQYRDDPELRSLPLPVVTQSIYE